MLVREEVRLLQGKVLSEHQLAIRSLRTDCAEGQVLAALSSCAILLNASSHRLNGLLEAAEEGFQIQQASHIASNLAMEVETDEQQCVTRKATSV